jgi:ankyrin repeat protein
MQLTFIRCKWRANEVPSSHGTNDGWLLAQYYQVGQTALMLSTDLSITTLLLDADADVNIVASGVRVSPRASNYVNWLYVVINMNKMKRGYSSSQFYSMSEWLTIVDQTGSSALLAAVAGKLHSVVALLLDHKADPNVVDNVRNNPLK